MLAVVVGTRPEIIMASPVIKELSRKRLKYKLIHSGQHYDYNMSRVFFKELSIPTPDIHLGVTGSNEIEKLSDSFGKFHKILSKLKPKATLVFGDTNTCLAAALVSSRLGIPIAHVESGNRTGDMGRVEETNRIMIDHISSILFCEGREMEDNLRKESVKGRIIRAGNPKFDAIKECKSFADPGILGRYGIEKKGKLMLVTIHRRENLTKERLSSVLKVLTRLAKENTIVFPVHPSTKKAIRTFGLQKRLSDITTLEPLSYLDFISFLSLSDLVITDSGGVPREAFVFGVPTILFHDNTDLHQLEGKTLFVSGYGKKLASLARGLLIRKRKKFKNPYIDAKSAEKIVSIITAV